MPLIRHSGSILRKPDGALAYSTNCCCGECCKQIELPATLFLDIDDSGSGACSGCSGPNPATNESIPLVGQDRTNDTFRYEIAGGIGGPKIFCDATNFYLRCLSSGVLGGPLLEAAISDGLIQFTSTAVTLHSCSPFHATGTINVGGITNGICGTPGAETVTFEITE